MQQKADPQEAEHVNVARHEPVLDTVEQKADPLQEAAHEHEVPLIRAPGS